MPPRSSRSPPTAAPITWSSTTTRRHRADPGEDHRRGGAPQAGRGGKIVRVASRDFVYVRELRGARRGAGGPAGLGGREASRARCASWCCATGRDGCSAWPSSRTSPLRPSSAWTAPPRVLGARGGHRAHGRSRPGGHELSLHELTVLHEATSTRSSPRSTGSSSSSTTGTCTCARARPTPCCACGTRSSRGLPGLLLPARLRAHRLPHPHPGRLRGHLHPLRDRLLRRQGLPVAVGAALLEPAAMAFGRVYCLGPTFRAEKSKTPAPHRVLDDRARGGLPRAAGPPGAGRGVRGLRGGPRSSAARRI